MSDRSSDTSSTSTDTNSDHRLLEFPLTIDPPGAATFDSDDLDVLMEGLHRRRRQRGEIVQSRWDRNIDSPPRQPPGFDDVVFGGVNRVPAVVPPPRTESMKPVVSYVSALKPTTYDEKNESDYNVRTLAYVTVQRALLKYLETQPADALHPRQARKWTQAIDPTGNKKPKAADALRLCYYMRSQGYDTYARVENKNIYLYVANQALIVRDHKQDLLYWKQNVATNEIAYAAPAHSRNRRNAIPDSSSFFGPNSPEPMRGFADGAATMRSARVAELAVLEAEARVEAEVDRSIPDPEYVLLVEPKPRWFEMKLTCIQCACRGHTSPRGCPTGPKLEHSATGPGTCPS
jgi:hypothetical protein